MHPASGLLCCVMLKCMRWDKGRKCVLKCGGGGACMRTCFSECVSPLEAAPVWSGPCPLWTAGPWGRAPGRPGSATGKREGWARIHAAIGRETVTSWFPPRPPWAFGSLYEIEKDKKHFNWSFLNYLLLKPYITRPNYIACFDFRTTLNFKPYIMLTLI